MVSASAFRRVSFDHSTCASLSPLRTSKPARFTTSATGGGGPARSIRAEGLFWTIWPGSKRSGRLFGLALVAVSLRPADLVRFFVYGVTRRPKRLAIPPAPQAPARAQPAP